MHPIPCIPDQDGILQLNSSFESSPNENQTNHHDRYLNSYIVSNRQSHSKTKASKKPKKL